MPGLVPVLSIDELTNGQMKEVEAEGRKILVARLDGQFYATGAQCPHYGASLAEGLLCGDRVICPWHKSIFRVTDGALLDPPALDNLARYPVIERDNRVFVQLPETPSSSNESAATPEDRLIVIAGAGAAGCAAAEQLRSLGFGGRLILISAEDDLPYDRTKLSKEFLSGNAGAGELPLRPAGFWQSHQVERMSQPIKEIRAARHELVLSDGTTLLYARLLFATGSVPRPFPVPGSDLGNVFTLRSEADSKRILAAAEPGVRTVIVGGSFIGMEVASCFAIRKLPVTVVVGEDAPFEKQLGKEVGQVFRQWHESHGVEFRIASQVERLEGSGTVRYVVLKNSEEKIPADLVVVGTGVAPATAYTHDLQASKDGGIIANAYLEAAQDVYVAGDLAMYPEPYSGLETRIEHWRVAQQQGRTAAANMLGARQGFESVPYFWTNHFGTRFDYLGHAKEWDEVILKRAKEAPAFLAFYIKTGKLVAAAACRHDIEISALHELFRLRRLPAPDDLRRGLDLSEFLNRTVRGA